MRGNLKYISSLVHRTPKSKNTKPLLKADLHTHPYINDVASLDHTLSVLHKNNISILANVVHGSGNQKEFDFWHVKELLKDSMRGYEIEDLDTVVNIYNFGFKIVITGGYEDYCEVEGVKGRLDIVVISSEKGFKKHMHKENRFQEKIKIARDYGGIVVSAHPYALWDPYGPMGFFKFRLASPEERKIIRQVVFQQVNCVDIVATNVAWMVISNDLVREEYPYSPLCSSNAHSINRTIRNEIGKSGCIFPDFDFSSGVEFREKLRDHIKDGNFETYLKYLGPLKFIRSIALSKPSDALA